MDAPEDIGARVIRELGFDLWPFSHHLGEQDEDWVFTIIEYAYGHVSKPESKRWHSYGGCGWHVTTSDRAQGQEEYREEINNILARYERRYVLAEDGLVYAAPPAGLSELLEPPASGDLSIDERVQSALRSFRRYGATDSDKRHAIHDLADVFEHLRDTVGTNLPSKDEGELFAIANQHGIRHLNSRQKTQYDTGPWLDWMFYAFLNACHLTARLTARGSEVTGGPDA